MDNSKGTEYMHLKGPYKKPHGTPDSLVNSLGKSPFAPLWNKKKREFDMWSKTSWGLIPSTTITLNKVNNIELRMKMMWTAEIKILNEDMIAAVVIAV